MYGKFNNYCKLFSLCRKKNTQENLLAFATVVQSNSHGSPQQHYQPLHQDYPQTPTEALFTTQTELPNITTNSPNKIASLQQKYRHQTELPTTPTGLTYPPPQQYCPPTNTRGLLSVILTILPHPNRTTRQQNRITHCP